MAENIRVYGTGWCPDTARSLRRLKRLGIAYDWFDVEQDDDACAFLLKVNNGNKVVPTIFFTDGSVLIEPSDEELEKKCCGEK
jgi:mycoredoxin